MLYLELFDIISTKLNYNYLKQKDWIKLIKYLLFCKLLEILKNLLEFRNYFFVLSKKIFKKKYKFFAFKWKNLGYKLKYLKYL